MASCIKRELVQWNFILALLGELLLRANLKIFWRLESALVLIFRARMRRPEIGLKSLAVLSWVLGLPGQCCTYWVAAPLIRCHFNISCLHWTGLGSFERTVEILSLYNTVHCHRRFHMHTYQLLSSNYQVKWFFCAKYKLSGWWGSQ